MLPDVSGTMPMQRPVFPMPSQQPNTLPQPLPPPPFQPPPFQTPSPPSSLPPTPTPIRTPPLTPPVPPAPTLAPQQTPIPIPTFAPSTPQPLPPPTRPPTPIPAPTVTPPSWVNITFYSYLENNDSTTIAYAQNDGFPTTASHAGGSGSYSNPLTMGSTTTLFSPGTKLYVYTLKKYVEMEDSCDACSKAWSTSQAREIIIWIGGNASSPLSALTQCENKLADIVATNSMGPRVYLNPPDGLPVDTSPLFNTSTNTCW